MLRFLYTLAVYLATPIILWRLAARGLHYRGYFSRWRERFGHFPDPGLRGCVWIHAVSVGEVNAAQPLVEALRRRYAPRPLVLTSVTPTGSERVRRLFGDSVFHVYLPYDLPRAVARFLDRIQPSLAVVMETEIWPNLFHQCGRRGIPLAIVNARLSERSLRGYRPIRALVRQALANVDLITAQSPADAQRYHALGADPARVHVCGNLKYDMPLPAQARIQGEALRAAWGARPAWIAASTHEGEDALVLEAHRAVLARHPEAVLLIAARHPERFRVVEQAAREAGLRVATHAAGDVGPATQCLVIDAMGVLLGYYAAADLAFVGGSLVPVGGHNVLEPAALARPVLVGPHTFNFDDITRALIERGGARRVAGAPELATAVVDLLGDPSALARMGAAAHAVCASERGALRRTMALLARIYARGRSAAATAATR